MSPADLGQYLKPFVFLDIFEFEESQQIEEMGIHPHSGIATVTVLTHGDLRFDDGAGHSGSICYGGVEWMRAGKGVWHGRELASGDSSGVTGFQLWLSLPGELELSVPDSQYIEEQYTPTVGPARVIIGEYQGAVSPVRAPVGINYLLVTLEPGKIWRYKPMPGHQIGWLAIARGQVTLDKPAHAGELVILNNSEANIELHSTGNENAVFVLGTAVPHKHELHLGNYSVHTSVESLETGESHIRELRKKLVEHTKRFEGDLPIPILR
jgi:redox-sensitive bicupin YhaK (pirin superfamily)